MTAPKGTGQMPSTTARRWVHAVRRVIGAERHSSALPSRLVPCRWHFGDRSAWPDGGDQAPLPGPLRRAEEAHSRTYPVPMAADLVQIGKFDVDAVVRLRAFYARAGVSLRLQVGGAGQDHGVGRTLQAYQHVSRHVPGLMPRVDDHGVSSRGVAYLVEELLAGTHPTSRRQMQAVAEPLAAALHRLHGGVGVSGRPLSAVVSPQLGTRWQAFADDAAVPPTLDAAVRRLVKRDGLLDVSLGHGDLVASNILVAGERVILLDWEYAGMHPIAFDLAKVHLLGSDREATRAALEQGLQGSVGVGRGHYSFAEQLALGHVQVLSWHRSRRRKAVVADRTAFLDRQIRMRLEALAMLLAVDGPPREPRQ